MRTEVARISLVIPRFTRAPQKEGGRCRDARAVGEAGVLKKVPKGKEVDLKVPLEDGGSDTVRNLQLLTTKRHADKTAREATARAGKKARAKKKK